MELSATLQLCSQKSSDSHSKPSSKLDVLPTDKMAKLEQEFVNSTKHIPNSYCTGSSKILMKENLFTDWGQKDIDITGIKEKKESIFNVFLSVFIEVDKQPYVTFYYHFYPHQDTEHCSKPAQTCVIVRAHQVGHMDKCFTSSH